MTKTKKMILSALFIVLSIILTRLLSFRFSLFGVESIRIGFGTLPIFLSALILGPWYGFMVGALADFFGYWINPMGPFMPHFTLTSGLHGLLPGLVFWYVFKKETNFWSFAFSYLAGALVGVTLTPYFIHTLFGVPYGVLMPPRIVSLSIKFFLYPAIMVILYKRIPQLEKLTHPSI
ncbi:putative membrane protein [Marinitoga piezophila KA3]|uniref:Putative membrane protein n=1 Tax=Marinitoga piezophila (strain DSM 14283 / JCM 11233 / KA3) TaxID=443254 RepID=H2J834_MARPK|nr:MULTISPECIES: folate family ECF transporter S component [Marinitoga]AEX85525.1 putative membrane protein [Marinitoga piezophila KA3]